MLKITSFKMFTFAVLMHESDTQGSCSITLKIIPVHSPLKLANRVWLYCRAKDKGRNSIAASFEKKGFLQNNV